MPEAAADAPESHRWWHWWRDHVVAGVIVSVLGFLIVGGLGAAWVWATSSSDDGGARKGQAAVQNVYNLPEERALGILRKQGFAELRTAQACSNSVGRGRVREVLLDNDVDVADETSLVNQNGSTGIEVPFTKHLAVKVSTGENC
jgi:hypothetical protein